MPRSPSEQTAVKWRVETDQGNFETEFDHPVTLQEARQATERQMGMVPEAPSPEAGLTGLRRPAGDVERQALRFLLPAIAVGLTGPIAGAAGITGTAGRLGLEALLGGLGEVGTQAVGLAEPSRTQIGLAAGAPLAGRAAGASMGFLRRQAALRLPGAGQSLRQAGVRTAEALPGTLAPQTASDELYALVERFDPKVPLKSIKPTLDKLLAEERLATPGLKLGTTERVAGGLKKEFFGEAVTREEVSPLLGPSGEKMFRTVIEQAKKSESAGFQQVRLLMRRLNDKIGAAKAKGGEGLGDLLQIKKSFAEALEQAADTQVGEAFAVLKEANSAFRQEIAQDTLTDIIAKNITPLEGREALNISSGKALKQLNEALRKDKFLEASFPAGSVQRIRTALEEIRKLPVIGAPPGAERGFGRGAIGFGLGAVGGELVLGPLGVPRGIAAGIGGLTAMGGASLISEALQTETGTKLLMRLIRETGGVMGQQTMALLAAGLRSGGAALSQ